MTSRFELWMLDGEVRGYSTSEPAANHDHVARPDVAHAGEVVERSVGILVPMLLGGLCPFALAEAARIECEDILAERMQRENVRQRVGE